MALPGYLASVAMTGASTVMTTESMTLVSGKTYEIDDAAKEVFDPDTALVVRDNTVTVAHSNIESIDLLHGTVTFAAAYTPTGPIDISGAYLPRTTIAKAFTCVINRSRDLLPDEKFGDTSKKKIAGVQDASGSVSIRDIADTTVGGGDSIKDLINDGTAFVLSFLPGTGLDTLRARILLESLDIDGDVAGQVIDNLAWQLASVVSADGYVMAIGKG